MSDSDCLFCKIVAGDIPSTEVMSTEATYAFRDIAPVAPTHVLVIPREHIADNASDLEPRHASVLSEMFSTAQSVAQKEGVEVSGYRLIFNVGDDAGNSVPHLHMHVLGGKRLVSSSTSQRDL